MATLALHCFEGLNIRQCSCFGKRKRRKSFSASEDIVDIPDSKRASVVINMQSFSQQPMPEMKSPEEIQNGLKFTPSGHTRLHRKSLRRRRNAPTAGTKHMRLNSEDWIATAARVPVNFTVQYECSTCLISTQRTVVSLCGESFTNFQSDTDPIGTAVTLAFESQFAALLTSVIENCFSCKAATAICVVYKRRPYNIIGYPLLVRNVVEGVLLVWRDDILSTTEFNKMIVTAS